MKKLLHIITAVLVIGLSASLAGCQMESGDNFHQQPTLRYQAVPLAGGGGALANLVYYAYSDYRNYYLFVLGHVNRVPIAFRDAIIFDGVTPITVGFERSELTEESVKSMKKPLI